MTGSRLDELTARARRTIAATSGGAPIAEPVPNVTPKAVAQGPLSPTEVRDAVVIGFDPGIATTGYEHPGEGDWYWVPKRQLSACDLEPMEYRFGGVVLVITSHIVPIILEGRFHGAVGVDQR
ncbi:MAG: hypothetical protein EB107_15955, partial [Proteobacteria bacterium]|nr:hypothetical protein [Pseudomonadota bacterium]